MSPAFSIELVSTAEDGTHATETASPFEIEHAGKPGQDPIDALLVTTKAQHVLPSISALLSRLSPLSTIVLLHNGLGVLEDLLHRCFPDPARRPSFVLAHTSHGVHRKDAGAVPGCHGRFVHAGIGDLPFTVLPSLEVRNALKELSKREWHWPSPEEVAASSGRNRHASLVDDLAMSFNLSEDDNPLLNPNLDSVPPSIDAHLPYLPPHTASLHTTISTLLSPSIRSRLGTKWISVPSYRIQSLAKLAVNCAANPLTGVIGCRNGVLTKSKGARHIIERVASEATAVFARLLETQDPGGDEDSSTTLDRRKVPVAPLPPGHPLSFESLMARINLVLQATGANISSTLADVQKIPAARSRRQGQLLQDSTSGEAQRGGQPAGNAPPTVVPSNATGSDLTEIVHLNGYLSRVGRDLGVPTPVNDTLVDLLNLKCEHVWSRGGPRRRRAAKPKSVGSRVHA